MKEIFKVIPNSHIDEYDQYFDTLRLKAKANPKLWIDFYKTKEEFSDIRPRFASSAHKSQGSTYRDVYIDLVDIQRCKDDLTRYRLTYTAITRAKRNVYIRIN